MTSNQANHTHFRDKYGPWALVTGAAQGIGAAYADALAARRLNLVLVDKQEEPLRRVCDELGRRTGVETRAVPVDLSTANFIETVREQTADVVVGLLICNAALGTVGPFLDERQEDLQLAIDINCKAPVILAQTYAKPMAERGKGGIIFMASGTGYYGNPFCANYAATKAYNLILGESLWYELRDCGVDVLAYVPGPTNTPGLRKSRPGLKEGMTVGMVKLPAQAAEAALEALGKAPSTARDWRMKLQIFVMTRILGRRQAIETFGKRLSKLKRTRNAHPS